MQQPSPSPLTETLDLEYLLISMSREQLNAFARAKCARYIEVEDLCPLARQQFLVASAYWAWCRAHGLPYMAISFRGPRAHILISLATLDPWSAACALDTIIYSLAENAPADSVASDRGERWICTVSRAASIKIVQAICPKPSPTSFTFMPGPSHSGSRASEPLYVLRVRATSYEALGRRVHKSR
jgi:hypothetical protein